MSTLASEDSPFQKFLDSINESLFGLLYTMQKTRKEDLVRLNVLTGLASILLDFFQLIPFFLHGFGWGRFTLTWGRYVRYVQLQIELTDYQSYEAAFWASVVIVGLIAIVTGVCFYSLYNKNTPNPINDVVLNLSYNVVLHILFIAGFKLLMTPWWCNPATQKLIPFPDVDCFEGKGLPNLIAGSIFAVILLVLVSFASLATVNLAPVPNDLFAVVTPSYRLAFYFALVFMTINENLIAPVIGWPVNLTLPVIEQNGLWWEALMNLIVMTLFFGVFIYSLPFQVPEGNFWRGGLLASAWWISACAFVTVNYRDYLSPSEWENDHVIDFVTFGGIFAFFFVGYYIVWSRYLVFKSLASSLIAEIEENFQSNELYRAKFGSKGEDVIVGGDRNPYIYLPLALQKFNADVTSIEVTGRLLWHNSSAKENIEAAYRLYRRAEQAYPDLAYVKFLRANCLTYLSPDPTAFIDQIEGVKRLEPSFCVQFLLFKRDMEMKYRGSMTRSEGNNAASDMISYVEFQKYYTEAQKHNKLAITAIRSFWELFLQPSIAFSAFNKASREIEAHTQKALSTYKTLIVRYPKHIYIISSYAYFLELVMHNAEEAERYHLRADQLRARENDETGLSDGGVDSQAVITISEEGTIEQINNATTKFFGWTRMELLTRNIKLLVPSPYKEKHDQFLDRYKATGNAKVVGLPPRKLYGQHRDGYSFAINLQVAERRKENGDRAFVGTLVPVDVDADDGVVIINEEGIIIMITKRITQMFGYSAVEMLRNNITMCMIDAYAANHETYLRRYKETGEAKVIGTAGRNVPARRKDATVFPASLVVEEEYIGGEKYFLAHILDTTHVTAIIYIDGMGTVQNCDQGISTLLGYRKEDLIGQNIKSVMPPPYNQYHDMYLERYRRTKISNILRSTDGRFLPALHADGTVVRIRAIIQRSDTGDGSDNLLFKGIIKRVDTDQSNASGGRIGFDEKNVIEMKKDGTIISVGKSILNTMGYPSDKDPNDYIGQPIEVLIPPVENRPQQARSFWMAQALAAQDLNFYILLLNKNYTLFPFTYNLSMKSSDVVLMRLRDVLATDALLTIDEIGTILSVNEDAYLLLGHDPDEVTGRNIKYIQAEEVASQHDEYLLRYKETRVARVVGNAREITTIHRDKSVIPIEIQVTEIRTADGINFIGRLRHLQIDERVPHEFVESFYRTPAAEDVQINFAEENATGDNDVKNPFEVEKTEGEIASDNEEDEESESSSSSSSSDDNEDEENSELASEIERKIGKLKLVDKEMIATRKLAYVLYGTFALLVSTLLAGLIASNVTPTPEPLFIFLDQLSVQSTIINRAIFALRLGLFEQEAEEIINSIKSTPGSEGYWQCSLGEHYTYQNAEAVDVDVETCPFVHKFDIKKNLKDMVEDLTLSQMWFAANYPKIRREGDALDQTFTKNLEYKAYENGMLGTPTTRYFATWTDFITAGFFDALSKLAETPIFDGSNLPSRLDYQFIQGNRDVFIDRMAEIQESVFTKIAELMATEALVHLVILIIVIVTIGVSFGVLMIPVIRNVMAERLLVLKLLLLVPKHLVWDFVFTIYRDDSEDDELGQDGMGEDTEKAKEDAKAKALKLRSEEVVDIINDNAYQLYLFFGLGLSSIILPVLIHVIWRYTFNETYTKEVQSYHDVSFLFTTANSLLWRATGILAPCNFRKPMDQEFCSEMKSASSVLKKTVSKSEGYLKALKDQFAGNAKIVKLFFSPEVLKDVYGSCNEKSKVTVTVDRVHFPNYKDFPADLADGETYTVPEKDFRCNDYYHADEKTYPYELILPEDYAVHFTRGIANTLRLFFQYAYELAETPGYNLTTAPPGPISDFSYFNVFEATEREAIYSIKYLKDELKDELLTLYQSSRAAFNATYIVTLIYVIALFGWVFESARKDLVRELQHNRGIIFMIPTAVVAKSKPMIEYVERVLTELIG